MDPHSPSLSCMLLCPTCPEPAVIILSDLPCANPFGTPPPIPWAHRPTMHRMLRRKPIVSPVRQRRAALQVGLDLASVFAKCALYLLVEVRVAVVDEVHVGPFALRTAPAELLALAVAVRQQGQEPSQAEEEK